MWSAFVDPFCAYFFGIDFQGTFGMKTCHVLYKTTVKTYWRVVEYSLNMITNPIYMRKCLKIKWYKSYPTIFRFLVYIVICIGLYNVIINHLSDNGWSGLLVDGLIVLLICIGIYVFIVLNKEERKTIICIMRRRVR